LREQGSGGQQPDERELLEQFVEVGLEGLRFGGLAVGDRGLGQAELDLLGEDVEQVDRVACGIMALLVGLAIDGDDLTVPLSDHAAEPQGEGLLELGQREAGQDATEGRGMRRVLAGEAQGAAESVPVVAGPALQGGQFGLTAHQAQQRQGQDRSEGVADAAGFAGVGDPTQGIEQGLNR
jgi:hypothetical protein